LRFAESGELVEASSLPNKISEPVLVDHEAFNAEKLAREKLLFWEKCFLVEIQTQPNCSLELSAKFADQSVNEWLERRKFFGVK